MWKDQEKECSRQSQGQGQRLRRRKKLSEFEEEGQERLVSSALVSHYTPRVSSPSAAGMLDPQGGCCWWMKLGMRAAYLEVSLHQFPNLYAGVKLYLPRKAATVNYPHSWITILFAGNDTQSCQTLKRFSVPYSPLLTDCVFVLPLLPSVNHSHRTLQFCLFPFPHGKCRGSIVFQPFFS